jgi:hypothetical protein
VHTRAARKVDHTEFETEQRVAAGSAGAVADARDAEISVVRPDMMSDGWVDLEGVQCRSEMV